ncbi:ArdC-like ssDNA-binding domain-containing protein [Sporichthya polymorpha]|uniref:ArdC-like ssDNA-binding domain-containing protein n=1 Tax=Sporichthya polymorpha TaxID=35751 RepID=UPI0003748D35|nr:ArdC-like ssDNA-binding domain-containing protein [Sporichthya polymorpha]
MSRTTPTRRADPGDRLAVAHAHLVSAVEALTQGEAWQHMLTVAARLPTYSATNILLIGIQCPDATHVAGIRAWNSLGRRVRKGEKGIAILAPCLSRVREGDERPAADSPLPVPRESSERPDAVPARRLRGFRVVHVFDASQTVGEPLPDVGPQLLAGDAPRLLTARLVDVIRSDGFTVELGPCTGTANGHTDFATRTVRVRDDVPDAQASKTLAHELGHIRGGHETRFLAEYRTSLGCRAQAEVEAESIAYLVTHAAGLPTEAYSVPYLAGWSGGDTDRVREAATRVIDTARGILTDLGLDRSHPPAPAPVTHRLVDPAALPEVEPPAPQPP